MANTASLNISATMLPDDISKTISDLSASYTPASDEGWYYRLTDISTSSADLISNANFIQLGSTKAQGGLATAASATALDGTEDNIKFLFVRHMGTTDDGTTSTDESIYLGIGVAAAHGTAACIEIPPNQSWWCKFNTLKTNDLHCISGDAGGTGAGSGTIQAQVFAIIGDNS